MVVVAAVEMEIDPGVWATRREAGDRRARRGRRRRGRVIVLILKERWETNEQYINSLEVRSE
jgi:hypothetical protein